MQNYNFYLLFFLVFTVYFGSLILVKYKKIGILKQRQFWNMILLVSFLISALLGLILAFSIDQKLSIKWYLPVLWWHVEGGIVMALVAIFHILWHIWYFKGLVKKKQ